MKVTISIEEVTKLILNRYSLPEGTIVSIGEVLTDEALTILNAVDRSFTDHSHKVCSDKKIAAIKELRAVMGFHPAPAGSCYPTPKLSLAEAKWTIEDWPNFRLHVLSHGVPTLACGSWVEFTPANRP